MAKLDDAGLRERLLDAVSRLDTTAKAAASVGTSRSAVAAYAAKDADFARALDAARHKRKVIDNYAPRAAEADHRDAVAPVVSDASTHNRDAYVALLHDHAADRDSRGCGKALHILGEYYLGSEVQAAKLEVMRRAAAEEDDAGPEPLQVRMGTAQSLRPVARVQAKHPRVLDAVVVGAKTDSSS